MRPREWSCYFLPSASWITWTPCPRRVELRWIVFARRPPEGIGADKAYIGRHFSRQSELFMESSRGNWSSADIIYLQRRIGVILVENACLLLRLRKWSVCSVSGVNNKNFFKYVSLVCNFHNGSRFNSVCLSSRIYFQSLYGGGGGVQFFAPYFTTNCAE